jgi:hypothetical protein
VSFLTPTLSRGEDERVAALGSLTPTLSRGERGWNDRPNPALPFHFASPRGRGRDGEAGPGEGTLVNAVAMVWSTPSRFP